MTFLQILSFSLVLGCIKPNSSKMSSNSVSPNNAEVQDTIALADLTIVDANPPVKNHYTLKEQLYSGFAVDYQMANDGMWSFVYTFKDGVMQRLDVHGVNGYQHRFVELRNGYDYHTVMYHRNGNRYLELFYDEKRNKIGIWKRWYESGELEWEKNYD